MGLFEKAGNFFYSLSNGLGNNANQYYEQYLKKLKGFNFLSEGNPSWETPDDENAWNLYLTTAQLYSPINLRGQMLSTGIWKHYKMVNGKKELVENSDVVKVLENPNPLMNGNDYLKLINENWCVFGNNYEYLNRPFENAPPAQLSILPPTQISIKTTGKIYKQTSIEDIIEYYKLDSGSVTDKFSPKDINHLRVLNSQNPIKGDSPLRPLIMAISNIRASYQTRNIIMKNKGAIGVLTNKSSDGNGALPLKADERERIEKAYKNQYGIGEDQMQILISNASLEWQSMSFPTKDLMLFEEVNEDFLSIIDVLGLNDNLFSKIKGSTYANLVEGFKQAYQVTIIPFSEEISMRYSNIFQLTEKNEWVELDYSHLPVLQKNEKEKAEVIEKKANAFRTLLETGEFTGDELKGIIEFD